MKINLKNQTGELNLQSAHTLVLGHKPEKVSFEKIADKLKEQPDTDLLSFGLWEVATPNYNTYYPDATVEDFQPKDEDFIFPLFRMLSETIVSKGAPIDFGKKGVLKKSMKMLLGQTINIDHEVAVGNAIGSVSNVYWQESYKTKAGIVVPAGINATLKIDAKSNPRIARGVMMEPPSIHSNSVTVRFKWEPSHDLEDRGEFYNKLGTYDDKGELHRLIVTDIMSYHETSLVSHGADVFAQKIKENGEIVNPEYSNAVYSFSEQDHLKAFVSMDYKTSTFSFSKDDKDNSIPNPNNNKEHKSKQNTTMDFKEIAKKLSEKFGLKEEDLTPENFVEKLQESFTQSKEDLQTQVTDLTSEKEGLEGEVETLTSEKEELEGEVEKLNKNKEVADEVISATRAEANRLYKLLKGDDADKSITKLITEGDINTVKSLLKDYQEEVEEKFGHVCQDCQSTNISRSTALTSKEGLVNDDGKEEGGDKNKKVKTNAQLRESLMNKKKKKSRIFDKNEED